jgi:uncharacterized protein (TIGR03000 family)
MLAGGGGHGGGGGGHGGGGGGHGGGGHGGGGMHAGGGGGHMSGAAWSGAGHNWNGNWNGHTNWNANNWHGNNWNGNNWHGGHDGHHHNNGFWWWGLGYGLGGYGGYGGWPYYGNGYSNDYYPDYYASAPANGYTSGYYEPTTESTAPEATMPPTVALLAVRVPPGAELWFDEQRTRQQGDVRIFASPALDPDGTYVYHLRAHWTQDGQPVNREQDVRVHAGDRVTIDLRFPEGKPVPAPRKAAPRPDSPPPVP